MVNGVPREVPRPKPEGPQTPRVLAAFGPRLISFELDKVVELVGGGLLINRYPV